MDSNGLPGAFLLWFSDLLASPKKTQVLFDDSLSTVWSAPNYCIQAAHPDGVFGETPKDDPIAEQCSKSRLIGSETSR